MNVVGFAGYSGSGKTTLVEMLIPALRRRGLRISVVKHAHHEFDIDHPGKDTFRHRRAGAFEVVVASDRRFALMRELEEPRRANVHELIAALDGSVDWVLVEGFKNSDLRKIEIWRAPSAGYAGKPALYISNESILAVATDSAGALPEPTLRPVLDLNDADAVAQYLVNNQQSFEYLPQNQVVQGGQVRS
jgi:molybdopterin-guanine dinucleotide biosynthesis adapter protein